MKPTIVFLSLLLATTSEVLAQSGFAPDNVAGAALYTTVTSGSGYYASSGDFIIVVAPSGNSYTLYGGPGIDGSAGTYTYTRTGQNTAEILLLDMFLGFQISQSVVFNSRTTGTYSISNAYGSQSGYFRISLPSSTSSDDWKYDVNYPWVWSPVDGWLYYEVRSDGLWVYKFRDRSWTRRP